MKLEGKVAVITGGNSGIGLATAREFAREGASLVLFGRDGRTLEDAARSLGERALAIQGDVRRLEDLERLFAEVGRHHDGIDILVVNAGIARFAPVDRLSEEIFDEVTDINFKGAFFTVQKALPHLRDGASVILVGTAGAETQGRPMTSIYLASKAAVQALARSFSSELLPRRIRVNVLNPGMIDTPIVMRSGDISEDLADGITQAIPLKRRGTPDEMAKAMLFLASDDSSYMLGANLTLDGGLIGIAGG